MRLIGIIFLLIFFIINSFLIPEKTFNQVGFIYKFLEIPDHYKSNSDYRTKEASSQLESISQRVHSSICHNCCVIQLNKHRNEAIFLGAVLEILNNWIVNP